MVKADLYHVFIVDTFLTLEGRFPAFEYRPGPFCLLFGLPRRIKVRSSNRSCVRVISQSPFEECLRAAFIKLSLKRNPLEEAFFEG